MKFFVSLFAAGALAASVARDVQTIQSAVSSISDATEALNEAVQAYNGGDISALTTASEAVVAAINSGTDAVKPTEEISLADALSLQAPIEALGELVGQTVDNAIAKKDALVAAGSGALVLEQLTQQRDGAKTFADTVTSKVPEAAQPIAADLSAPILNALNRAVEAFSDQTGSPSSSASGPSSSAAPTPSGSASIPVTTATPTVVLPTGSPTATPPPFTGAAMPTAAAGFGAAAVAAMVAVAAL